MRKARGFARQQLNSVFGGTESSNRKQLVSGGREKKLYRHFLSFVRGWCGFALSALFPPDNVDSQKCLAHELLHEIYCLETGPKLERVFFNNFPFVLLATAIKRCNCFVLSQVRSHGAIKGLKKHDNEQFVFVKPCVELLLCSQVRFVLSAACGFNMRILKSIFTPSTENLKLESIQSLKLTQSSI